MYDLVVVGMGSAGITAAEFAAHLDLRVAVVERERIGGDCLWTGCVPSKALLAAGRAAHTMRTADRFGLDAVEPVVDLARVWRRIRAVQAQIAATDDNPQRFRDIGVEVVEGVARLTGADEVTVHAATGERVLSTRFVLVCTGSRPRRPDIPGLPADATFTSDDLFTLDSPPPSVAIIGGGPMGAEMAQGLRRLGVEITLFQRAATLLPREDPSLVQRLTDVLEREGVVVHTSADVRDVTHFAGRHVVHALTGDDGRAVDATVDGILLATGRTPNTAGLGLEELGVVVGPDGVEVDDTGRTAVRSVYAVGDVTNGFGSRRLLTNTAGYQGVIAVRNMFFPGRSAADRDVPSCVFTDPELARVGLTVAEAEAAFGTDTDSYRFDLDRNDRARTEASTDGGIVVVTGKGKVVGAHVLAPGAGEVIHELALAVHRQLRVDELAELVHVYPTVASAIGQLASEAAYEKAHRLRWLMRRR